MNFNTRYNKSPMLHFYNFIPFFYAVCNFYSWYLLKDFCIECCFFGRDALVAYMFREMVDCNNVNYLVSCNLDHSKEKKKKVLSTYLNQSWLLNNSNGLKRFTLFAALLISYWHRLAGSCNAESLPSVFFIWVCCFYNWLIQLH